MPKVVEMPLHEFANRASNILFGYGEATEGAMLKRMEELIEAEKALRLYQQSPRIAQAFRDAAATVQAVMGGESI